MFDILSRALTPFYAARAYEETRYGLGGITQSTAFDICIGAEIANLILAHFRSKSSNLTATRLKLLENSFQSGIDRLDNDFITETEVSNLIEISYLEAKRLVIQRNNAIEKVAHLILSDPREMI